MSSPSDSPASPAITTSETFVKATKAHEPDGLERWEQTAIAGTLTDHSVGLPASTLICSSADSPARTSPSPDSDAASRAPARACSTSSPESLPLFDLDGSCSRTSPASYRRLPKRPGETWESSSVRWPTSATGGPTEFWTHATSESPSDAVECSLSAVLEEITDPRYLLSARAARGVLRRAGVRGRNLPPVLEEGLRAVGGAMPTT